METRLRRASQEVPQYCRMVFTKCEGLVTRFDNLYTHELGQTQELQTFTAKFDALKRDLVGVLAMMSEECDIAPSLPPVTPPPTHCAVLSHTVNADVTAPDLYNVGTVVAPRPPPNHATQNHGSESSDDGAASHITTSTRGLTSVSSVDSVPLIQTAMDELAQFSEKSERFWNLLPALRNPVTIFNQLKDKKHLTTQELWSYFTSWTVICLSKKAPAEMPKWHIEQIIDAFGAVQHTVKFSAENFIDNDKAPPVGMLKEAARLFRDGKVLNVQASDADMHRLPDRRNSGVPDGKRGGG
jgi:hypothetical protein